MADKLKPNQEKKVIENFVECIMDDLDYYHFDELIMEKYKKELFQFFTKISEERSLFSPGFDFSNKKNTVNDKKKLEAITKIISKITPPAWTAPLPGFIPHQLQEIKKILEK